MRGFKKVSWIESDIPMPKRGSIGSAGYDIYAICPATFECMGITGATIEEAWRKTPDIYKTVMDLHGVKLPTGIKAFMGLDEYLSLYIRSSAAMNDGLMLATGTSIIDSDYYNNPDNEGHIIIGLKQQFYEFKQPIVRICQGVFHKYLIADNDFVTKKRKGGIGSTDEA